MTTKPWGHNDLMAMCAVRYCLGRMTYIVRDCRSWLVEVWPDLCGGVKVLIKRDIEEAFERDDTARRDEHEHRPLGMDCDRADWEEVRKLWRNNDESL